MGPRLDLSIHTIALWASTSPGMGRNSSGAAGSTTFAASRRNRQPQQIPTIARMGSRIGKQAGLSRRRSGAAGSTVKVVHSRAVGARHLRSLTTAMPGSPIGRLAGVSRRSPGAVPTKARAAPWQVEDALELELYGLS